MKSTLISILVGILAIVGIIGFSMILFRVRHIVSVQKIEGEQVEVAGAAGGAERGDYVPDLSK